MRASVLWLSLSVALPAGVAQPPTDRQTSAPAVGRATDQFHNNEGVFPRYRSMKPPANATPVIRDLSSPAINSGAPFTMEVQGSGFVPGSPVTLDTKPVPTRFVSGGALQITGTSWQLAGSGQHR